MATNKHIANKLALMLWMATFVVMPNVSSAAPGTLAAVPLFTAANADPNIMFLLDTSYSMGPASPLIGGQTREAIAKGALRDLLNSLSNVRAGLSIFEDNNGAELLVKIDDISTTNTLIDTILGDSATNSNDSTPLGNALMDVGRYFANDQTSPNARCGGGVNADLTLHPGQTNEVDDRCTDILGSRTTRSGVGPGSAYGFNINTVQGPIIEHCASNFTILLTDGLARGDQGRIQDGDNADTAGGDPTDPAHNESGKHPLYDYDGDCSATAQTDGGYTCEDPNPARVASFPFSPNSNGPEDHHDRKSTYTYDSSDVYTSDHLDDVAQALYEMDLRPDLDDDDGNEAINNMRTFVIGFADPAITSSQLLMDTANQGGGTFSYANDGTDLAASLAAATASILNLIGSAAAVTFNTATLGANSSVYLALFNSSSWSGDLIAYDLNDTTGAIGSQTWSAGTRLDALSDVNAVNNRVILTHNGTKGIPFRWPADHTSPTADEIGTAQINDLLTNAPGGATVPQLDALGQARVDFLRGDTSIEGTTVTSTLFRNRTSRLGDIVHAGPVFVGAPELGWPDGSGGSGIEFPSGTDAYSYFKYNESGDTPAGAADRPGVVYVGSNDGMLHGFATEDVSGYWSAGDEVLAYAPAALFSTDATRGYHYLTESGYNHQYYVDLQPTISDIYDSGWKTVLVGGLRGGGRGIYALDVTNPLAFSESGTAPFDIVMGEFTNAIEPDLGYTTSQPTIAKMENGRWAIIMGNGYNLDTGAAGATGEASLIIIYLTGGGNIADGWDEGTAATDDYLKISTGVGGLTAATLNGLSTPALIDTDGNGMIDRAYAGDLMGNMWAFDLSDDDDTNPVTWNVDFGAPLFTAGPNQPITSQPEVVRNPDASGNPNTIVLFGTGQYISSSDNAYAAGTPLGNQAFYGVWDSGSDDSLTVSDLTAQYIDSESGGLRTVTSNTVNYQRTGPASSKNWGWYINLGLDAGEDGTLDAPAGERVVTNPVVRGDIVYFNTTIPSSVTCSYGGDGWQMSVQYKSGANPAQSIFDANGNGVVGDDSAYSGVAFTEGLPAAPSFLSDRRYTPGTKTQTGSQVVDDAVEQIGGMGTGRLSWEELFE